MKSHALFYSRHDIVEILFKLALSTNQSINLFQSVFNSDHKFLRKKSQSEIWIFTIIFGGVIFSLLASSYVDLGSDTQVDQSKEYFFLAINASSGNYISRQHKGGKTK